MKYKTALFYCLAISIILVLFNDQIDIAFQQQLNFYRVRSDSYQHNFPYWVKNGDEVFRDDYIASYYLNAIIPTGVKYYFSFLAHYYSPIAIGKYTSFLLSFLFIFFLTESSRKLFGYRASFLTLFFSISFLLRTPLLVDSISRAFGHTIIAAGIYACTFENKWALPVVALIGALTYPISGAILAVLYGVLLVMPQTFPGSYSGTIRVKSAIFLMFSIAFVLAIAPLYMGGLSYGPRLSIANSAEFPEIGRGGRYAPQDLGINQSSLPEMLFNRSSLAMVRNRSISDHLKFLNNKKRRGNYLARTIFFGILLCLSILFVMRRKFLQAYQSKNVCRVFGLFICTILMFYLSILTFPHLYMPQRYPLLTTYPLTLLLIPGMIIVTYKTFQSYLSKIGIIIFLLAPLITINGALQLNKKIKTGVENNREIYEFLESLPQDSLIAGWPTDIIESVPLYTAKSALLTQETHQVFHKTYLLEMRARATTLFDAYLNPSPKTLKELQKTFGVTHLIVTLQRAKYKYFSPFNLQIAKLLTNNPDFMRVYSSSKMQHATVYRDSNYQILNLDLIEENDP